MTYYYVRQITDGGQPVKFNGTVHVKEGGGTAYLYASCQMPTQKSWIDRKPESENHVKQLSGGDLTSMDWEVKFVPDVTPFTAYINGTATWYKFNT